MSRRFIWIVGALLAVAALAPAGASAQVKHPTKSHKHKTPKPLTWSRIGTINTPNGISALSCPSAKLCVAAGGDAVLTTGKPTGSVTGWHSQVVDSTVDFDDEPDYLTAVGCVSSSNCVVGDDSNYGWTSTAPASVAWTPFSFPRDELLSIEAIGCSPLGNCTALNVDNHAISTAGLASGASWNFLQLPNTSEDVGSVVSAAVSCPSHLCAVVNSSNMVYITTNSGTSWQSVKVASGADLVSVDCVTNSFCIAGGDAPGGAHVWLSRRPTLAGSWRPVTTFSKSADWVSALACATVSRCFVALGTGIYSSADPAKPKSWVPGRRVRYGASQIVCPSAHECLATDQNGDLQYTKF